MKCPYCGVHYLDGEKECPVCGKRAGILAPKQKSNYSSKKNTGSLQQEKRYQPKSAPASTTAKKQTYDNQRSTEAAWQQAARGAHVHDNPLEKKKKPSAGMGCFIFILVIIVINVAATIGFSILDNFSADDILSEVFGSAEPEEAVYYAIEPCELFTGTYTAGAGDLLLTIAEDNTVTWTDGTNTYTDSYASCEFLDLNEYNANSYCSDEELKFFPLDSYRYFTLYASDYDLDEEEEHDLDIQVYVPREESDTISVYDYKTGIYTELIRQEPSPEPSLPTAKEQNT